ncbi:MAG TPA: class I SAM-dependent methyltransferase [Chryseolinea sp.]
MAAPFDHIATFDSVLTRSVIGQLQRKQVWNYLERITPDLDGLEILELNCGTGDDALLFSEKGFNIVATDVSEEMLKVTVQKANQFSMQNKISSHYLDLDSFDETLFDKKFDLIFCNFGVTNCINPDSLKKLLHKIPSLLSPGGRFVAIIMPKFCLWESLYMLLKFRFRRIFRRMTNKGVIVDRQGNNFKTWYYNPSRIKRWAGARFKVVTTRPVGFALPPSQLESNFTRRKGFLLRLNNLEKKFHRVSILSGMADQFIIDLQLK